MALVKFGGGVTQMSGSIAGNTHARNRYGNYIRPRTKPVNPRSTRQTAARLAMMWVVEYWHDTLTAAQRGAWQSYADMINWQNALGETMKLSGFNHFVRTNLALAAISGTIVADGPTTMSLPQVDAGFAISASEATQQVSVSFDGTDAWDDEDDAHLVTHIGQPQIASRNFFNGPWRRGGYLSGSSTSPPTSPAVTTSPWTLTQGQVIWAFHRILRADGRLSNEGFAGPVVVGA